MLSPSRYQVRIRDFVASGTGSGIVNAVAGSGKTSTIVWACEAIPSDKSCLFLCFNRSIAQSLRDRLPPGLKSATLNAVGHGILMAKYPGMSLNRFKMRALHFDKQRPVPSETSDAVLALAGYFKAYGLYGSGLTQEAMNSLVDRVADDENAEDWATVKRMAVELVELSMKDTDQFDFDDQLYVPVVLDLPAPKYDWIIVDEAQDLSPVQTMLIRKLLKDDGRLLAVGDEKQAIYGFRGADPDSMQRLREEFDAVTLPLTITYRCAKDIVSLAQTIVPWLEPAPKAPGGSVAYEPAILARDLRDGDLVLCRRNAPLVTLAYQMVAKRKPVTLMGAAELAVKMRKKFSEMRLHPDDRPNAAALAMNTELDRMTRLGQRHTAKYEATCDLLECVEAISLAVQAATLREVAAAASRLASAGGPVLASIHKAKGLEAERVLLIDADYIFRDQNEPGSWRAEQEWNLLYVALTRAKTELILETDYGEDWKKQVAKRQAHQARRDSSRA